MISQMSLWAAALWGFIGAAAIEAWDLYGAIHRVKGFPWKFEGEVTLAPYLVSVVLRVLLGVGMALAFVASGQADGPVGVSLSASLRRNFSNNWRGRPSQVGSR